MVQGLAPSGCSYLAGKPPPLAVCTSAHAALSLGRGGSAQPYTQQLPSVSLCVTPQKTDLSEHILQWGLSAAH